MLNYEGGLDYRYAKTLPNRELEILIHVLNTQRKEHEAAMTG